MTPLLLIDCASSWSRVSSTWPRGWNWLGASRSMSVSVVDDDRSSGASGMSALRPLPSAGRFSMSVTATTKTRKHDEERVVAFWLSCRRRRRAFEDFAREREVRLGAARFDVVENYRH